MPHLFPILFLFALTLLAGPAHAAFDPNPDGTLITDTDTGLIWDRCSLGQSWNAATSHCDGAADFMDWAAALNAAMTANTNNHLGHNDWRLPSIAELESLVLSSSSSPAIDTTAFPDTPSNWYWTSTTFEPNPVDAWVVNFFNGNVYASQKTVTDHVRLVRSGQSYDALANGAAAPTLSEWAMFLLVVLLAGLALQRVRSTGPRA
jgi:hypothetical protein